MSTIIITADSGEADRLFASTVRAMCRGLDATEDQLVRASGIGRQRLQTIETGGTTARADMSQVIRRFRSRFREERVQWPDEQGSLLIEGASPHVHSDCGGEQG